MYSTKNGVFNFLDKDELLIGAWVAPPQKDVVGNKQSFINEEQYRYIKESGINTIYALYERGDNDIDIVKQALQCGVNAGVNYLVRDERLKNIETVDEYNSILKEYRYSKAFSGFLFWDEPGMIDYPNVYKVHELSRKSIDPSKLVYVNLLPLYATSDQLWSGAVVKEKTTKEIKPIDYYEAYVKETNPSFLSYDFYPFEGEFPNIKAGFYEQYSMVNKIAMKYQLPTMCFIQALSFNENTRIPTHQEISFHVNVSLAYNTKGIQYFTYFLPTNDREERFKGAMINHQGEKTKIYESVKSVNAFIRNIQADLKPAKWQGIVTSVNVDIPMTDRIYLKDIFVNADYVITGVYHHNDTMMLFCVNTSLTDDTNVSVIIPDSKTATITDQETGLTTNCNTNKPVLFSLKPGYANLIKIYNK